jgi:predicted O-linked N-acetylglucosamine transferase (SPINDLY family)
VLEQAAGIIRQAKCDNLYYWEVCSDALNYFLPFYRLAPVQCTSHGSQISSGNPNLDWFYSSALMEVADAQEHYSEKLWLGQALLIKQSRLTSPPRAKREDFQLPEDRTLYMSLQNPLKFHPDFDPLLRGILEGDPRGQIVLLGGTYAFAQRDLQRRFERTLGAHRERVTFLPFQKFAAYLQLIELADVVLDPPHFGAGSSAYDVFSFGQPLVTMPTAINVGRVGAAFYQRLELDDFISLDAQAYVRRAVQLGIDRDFRHETGQRLAARTPELFDDQAALRQHERFLAKIGG